MQRCRPQLELQAQPSSTASSSSSRVDYDPSGDDFVELFGSGYLLGNTLGSSTSASAFTYTGQDWELFAGMGAIDNSIFDTFAPCQTLSVYPPSASDPAALRHSTPTVNSAYAQPSRTPPLDSSNSNFPSLRELQPTIPDAAHSTSEVVSSSGPTTVSSHTRSTSSSPPSADQPVDRKRKRERNTEAARRYRQRKVDRTTELEEALAVMTKERDDLRLKLARAETVADVLRGMVRKGA